MEYLPLPRHPIKPNIQVPYLCTEDFDDGPVTGFPERRRWDVSITAGNITFYKGNVEVSVDATAAFVQTWLWFGLLRNTVGPGYRTVAWHRTDDDGNKFLDATGMQELVASWSEDMILVDDVGDLQPLKRRLKDADKAIKDVRSLTGFIARFRPEVMARELLPALALLGETLFQVLKDVASIDVVTKLITDAPLMHENWRLANVSGKVDMGQLLLEHMENAGWCPSDVGRIKESVEYFSTLHYLAPLDPPRAHVRHVSCTKNTCHAARIDTTRYELSHASAGCRCELIRVEPEALANILQSGRLPLIEIGNNNNGNGISMSIRAYEPGEDFVALSHVWAEGLGNPFDNALHGCELTRVSEYTISLSKDARALPLWIDTICVPVRPKELHQLAMTKMREPYRLASHVLVLDAYLLKVPSAGLDTSEIFARILCCSWLQRLWTLQEGRLAKAVCFQFADGAINLREQFQNTSFKRIPSQVYRCTQLDLIFSYNASRFTDKINAYNGDIEETRRAIKARSVSVPSDEALCIACLMNMELDDIVSAPEAARIAVFWRKQTRVPRGMVFSKAQQKINQTGLHWAPASFLGFTPRTGTEEDSWFGPNHTNGRLDAIPSERGLQVRLPGYLFHADLPKMNERYAPDVRTETQWDPFNDNLFLRETTTGIWYLLIKQEPWTNAPRSNDTTRRYAVISSEALGADPGMTAVDRDWSYSYALESVRVAIRPQSSTVEQGILEVEGCDHLRLAAVRKMRQLFLEAVEREVAKTLAEKGLHHWLYSVAIVEECRAKAVQILEDDPQLVMLAEGWAREEDLTTKSPAHMVGDFMAVLGAVGDLLTLEPLPQDQLWCVD